MNARTADVSRETRETRIRVKVNLDGTGQSNLSTGIGFFDHMLDQIARHGLIDLDIQAEGDLHIDGHHTVEDVGITLGQAVAQAVGDKRGIMRYGHNRTVGNCTSASIKICDSGFNRLHHCDFDCNHYSWCHLSHNLGPSRHYACCNRRSRWGDWGARSEACSMQESRVRPDRAISGHPVCLL
jgi:hypothetical protein